jgi:hypothetical protein
MALYKYRCRPSYFSDNLLIELFAGTTRNEAADDFLAAIKTLNAKITDRHEDWMNDGYSIDIATDDGILNFERDIWGFIFISATPANNALITCTDKLLNANSNYEKEEVDFEKYKNAPPQEGGRPGR